jgi:hypothetical protein
MDLAAKIIAFTGAILGLAAVVALILRTVNRMAQEMALRDKIELVVAAFLGNDDPRSYVPGVIDRLERMESELSAQRHLLEEHLRWHGNPRGAPARTTPPRSNGPGR